MLNRVICALTVALACGCLPAEDAITSPVFETEYVSPTNTLEPTQPADVGTPTPTPVPYPSPAYRLVEDREVHSRADRDYGWQLQACHTGRLDGGWDSVFSVLVYEDADRLESAACVVTLYVDGVRLSDSVARKCPDKACSAYHQGYLFEATTSGNCPSDSATHITGQYAYPYQGFRGVANFGWPDDADSEWAESMGFSAVVYDILLDPDFKRYYFASPVDSCDGFGYELDAG